MHFSSAAALFALSSLSVSYAAPFVSPQEDLLERKVDYKVVNVGGDLSSSAPPEIIETVTQTVKSIVTPSVAVPTPVTVTVTATPSSTPYFSSTATPSSTPYSRRTAPSSAASVSSASRFLRRGLNAAGYPYGFARSYGSSVSSVSIPVSTTPLGGDYSSWYSSAPLPSLLTQSSSWGASVSATPLARRNYATYSWGSSASPSLSSRRAWSSASSAVIPCTSFSAMPSATPLLY